MSADRNDTGSYRLYLRNLPVRTATCRIVCPFFFCVLTESAITSFVVLPKIVNGIAYNILRRGQIAIFYCIMQFFVATFLNTLVRHWFLSLGRRPYTRSNKAIRVPSLFLAASWSAVRCARFFTILYGRNLLLFNTIQRYSLTLKTYN